MQDLKVDSGGEGTINECNCPCFNQDANVATDWIHPAHNCVLLVETMKLLNKSFSVLTISY